MLDMKRRYFLGVTAATVAVAAVPILSADVGANKWLTANDDVYAIRGDTRPTIGSKFFVWTEFKFDSFGKSLPRFTAGAGSVLRRVERIEGVILGSRTHEATWHRDRWVVLTTASVIGYA